ncbi:E3 SUMO-protein ligase ZBED1-like isoform X1 [Nerophis lumbriciformis]|uniref:E3 SUMO-protein ligase ZBED1-like isoform X1 n=2 Tax=Nerophis lumbriciformis TaxID=546530 RepID=UPI002ADF6A84|nr:E3 SUMO-protein ligase ZBED1-like isoform X1 [Nerophis lumbriciformis]
MPLRLGATWASNTRLALLQRCSSLDVRETPWRPAELQVKCRICTTELSYVNKSTSSMLRHYRARHEHEVPETPRINSATRKQMLDEALLNFIVTDCQPLSIVESEGFRELVQVLEPSYVLPTRKTIKKTLEKKYEEERERVKLEVQQAVAVSITADMWTSVNMEAYLALTCHYINDNLQLCTSVLGVQYFPQSHTADNLAQVKRGMMADWAITNKVKCFVTDAAPNMIASTRQLQIRHSICIAHSLNLLVRKSCDQIPTLASIRHKARHIVTYFRSSTTAKEKLAQVQQQMGRPTLKLINEVATRWNSTYEMLSRLHDEKESVWVSLASLKTDLTPLTADEFDIIGETLIVLAPFHQATVELSEERRVSGSKVIPMMKMLYVALEHSASTLQTQAAKHLHENLKRRVTDTASNMESLSVLTLATLLDPRFKSLGFRNSFKLNDAIIRLRSECASVIGRTNEPLPGPSAEQLSAPTSGIYSALFVCCCLKSCNKMHIFCF